MTPKPLLTIFDCDGVLIDSEILASKAFKIAMQVKHGINISLQEIIERYVGKSEASTNEDLQNRYGITLSPYYSDYEDQIRIDLFESELEAIPDVVELVMSVEGKKCVASSSSPQRLRHSLGLVGLWDIFSPHIFSAAQVKNGKPAPDLFLFAVQQMGVDPADCLVIEDSVAGVRAAVAAGMKVYGFVGGSHCGPDHAALLRQNGATEIFTVMVDLAKALGVPIKQETVNIRLRK